MVQLYDSLGNALPLGRRLGRGGEGEVYEIGSDGGFVAKVYHRPVSRDKAEKLRCMAAVVSRDLTNFAAWPTTTLHKTLGGEVVGIALPRVKGHEEIHNLYSPAHRKLKYPDKDWAFLVHVGMNCAAAFDAIHRKGHVIGDVNQGNVLISKNGTVFLIDCDSFQVAANGHVFLCEVGVPQFTPPELQNQTFRRVRRTPNHDCFGLAVLLFHLLFMGRHPFAGRFRGQGEMPIERAIVEYRFAFSRSAAAFQMERPPHSLPICDVAPQLADMFERSFGKGSETPGARPSAREWHGALTLLRRETRACDVERGHLFPRNAAACPWCRIVQTGGPDFFVSVTAAAIPLGAFAVTVDVAVLWRRIAGIRSPEQTFLRPTAPPNIRVTGMPAPPAIKSAADLTALVGTVAAVSGVAMLMSVLIPALALFSVPLFAAFAIWWVALVANSPRAQEYRRRVSFLQMRRRDLDHLYEEWENAVRGYGRAFGEIYSRMSQVANRLGQLKAEYDRELAKLEQDCRARQLAQFLQGKFLSDVKIKGIGAGRKAVLESFGIETAYDIPESVTVLGSKV